jgi:NAD(P)-dependent dehydrogenase (short-subunit alcohol dehydrogenase family)
MEVEKTAVVTGGNKGIGASISRAFYNEGYYVIMGSRNDHGLAKELGERALFHSTDVCKPQEVHRLVRTAVERTGRLDVMVNNAGFSEWCKVEEVDEEFWKRMVNTNLKGTFFGCQAASLHLQRGGCIINISSLAGKRGSANNSVYCASKFGVNGITQALAKELGPRGIRVNAVCPVYIRTEGLLEALSQKSAPPGSEDVETYLRNFAASNSALGLLPTGEEIGQVCLFLASQNASSVTGQCINVDCGVLPQ